MASSCASPVSTAILIASGTGPDGPGPALLPVLGIPIIEWQVRAVRRAGIRRVLLLAEPLPEPLATRLADGIALERLADPSELSARLSGTVLLLAEGVIIDHRALRALVSKTAPALMQFALAPPQRAERIDRDSHWAGAALLPATLVAETADTLGEWELAATLLRVADTAGAERIALEASEPCLPDDSDRRLPPPLAWFRPADAAAANEAGQHLLLGAVPHGPDLADRHLYRPLALALARLLAGRIGSGTPLCWLGVALLFLAIPLMAFGFQWPALAFLILAPPMDQTGRILATAQGLPLPRIRTDETAQTMLVALALASLALPLALSAHSWIMAPLLAGGGLLMFTAMRTFRLRWYRRRIGSHLDMRSPLDSRIIGLMGPATSMILPFLPFVAAGLWGPGLLLITGWSVLLFLLLEWRFLVALDTILPPRLI